MAAWLVIAAIVALPLIPSPAAAIWTPDGFPVGSANGSHRSPSLAGDGAGGAFVAWMDSSGSTGQDIRVHHILPDGSLDPAWPSAGQIVCAADSDQYSPAIVADGSGGAIVVWEDYRNGIQTNLYAARINAAGAIQWTPDGVLLCRTVGDQYEPKIISDGAGGAIVVWRNYGNGFIHARRIDAAGDTLWAAGGVALSNAGGGQYDATIASDGAGGAIVAWSDVRTTFFDIYAQRIDATGAVRWVTDGALVCGAAKTQGSPAAVADGAGGAIITWFDFRSDTSDVYAQRMSASGVPGWGQDGIPVCAAVGDQGPPHIVPDGAGGAIVAWEDTRSRSNFDLYAQRLNPAGVIQWTFNGAAVCTTPTDQTYPQLVPDAAGGALIAWIEGAASFYVQRINSAGAILMPASGLALCTPGPRYDLTMLSDGYGGAFVAWTDFRRVFGLGDVYVHHSPFQITATAGGNGSISPAGTTWVAAGTDRLFGIFPDQNFYTSDVISDSTHLGPVWTHTYPAVVRNHTLQALFDNAPINAAVPTNAERYTSFAFTIWPASDAVQSVMSSLWPPDDKHWRFASWDPTRGTNGSYLFAGSGLDQVRAGLGYWLVTRDSRSVPWSGKPLTIAADSLTLPGPISWQLIGNPFRFAFASDSVKIVIGSQSYGLKDAGNVFTEHQVYEAGYSTPVANTMMPGRAYWLRKTAAGAVGLTFPITASAGAPAPPALSKPDGAKWAVGLVARQGDFAAEPLVVGATRLSRPGWNPLCRMAAPSPPGGAVRVSVSQSDWGDHSGEYLQLYQPEAEVMSWNLTVSAAEAPGEMTLDFTAFDLPAGSRIWLADPAQGWEREVEPGEAASLAATSAPRALRLTVTSASASSPATTSSAPRTWRAYPNPSAGSSGLLFTLDAGGDVTADVLDLQGRRLRTIERRSLPPGEHVLVWDGRDASGRNAPPGVYLVRYHAGRSSGALRIVRVE